MPNYDNPNTYAKTKYLGALPDRRVPACPRCGYLVRGWPPQTVGITYAACPRWRKIYNR